jgi:hypothetical protein
MIDKTHSETCKVLKNDFVILARGGCRRTKRGERHGLRGGGGIGETRIIRTARERKRGTCSTPLAGETRLEFTESNSPARVAYDNACA